MRWNSKFFLNYALALVLTSIAWGIILQAGLPQRADYTGITVEGLGYAAPEIGAFAPPIRATLLDGTGFDSRAETGKWLILNFWATWCIPCEVEMPVLDSLSQELNPEKVQIIAINVAETDALVRNWLNEHSLILPVALDPDLKITSSYQLRGQPTTFIIAPDGTISQIIFGPATETQLRAAINYP